MVEAEVLLMVNLKQNENTSKQNYAEHKNGFKTLLQRLQECETRRNSQLNIGRNEGFSKHVDEIAQDDHPYVATWQERQWHEKGRIFCFHSQGLEGPLIPPSRNILGTSSL